MLEYGVFEPPYFVDKELLSDPPGQEKREADLVARARFVHDEKAKFLVHIEIQSQTEPDFIDRLFIYFGRLREAFKCPVYPIALFTYNTVRRNEPSDLEIVFPDRRVSYFSMRSIQLKQLHWRDFAGQKNPILAAFMAKMYYEPHERPSVFFECMRLLAELNLSEEDTLLMGRFVRTYLPLDAKEMGEYHRLKEALPMGKQQQILGVETYWERMGRLEGERVGEKRGERRVLMVQLEQRFGPMPREDRARLETLSTEELDRLAVAILTAASYDAWREELLVLSQTNSSPADNA